MSHHSYHLSSINLQDSQPSLCIPRVFNNITERRIRHVFDELRLGKIERVDIKERRNEKGDTFKRVFIHFEKWYWNDDAKEVRRKLLEGKEIKIVYDNPWFWKVSANKWTPNVHRNKEHHFKTQKQRPFIENDKDEFGRDLNMRRETELKASFDEIDRCKKTFENQTGVGFVPADLVDWERLEKKGISKEEFDRKQAEREIEILRERDREYEKALKEEFEKEQKRQEEQKRPPRIDNPDDYTEKNKFTIDYGEIKFPLKRKPVKKPVQTDVKNEETSFDNDLYGDL